MVKFLANPDEKQAIPLLGISTACYYWIAMSSKMKFYLPQKISPVPITMQVA